MHEVLDWTYAQAGGMNTANALGYIIGAATAEHGWASRGRRGASPASVVGTVHNCSDQARRRSRRLGVRCSYRRFLVSAVS
jgi:hypothetical protein